MGELRKQISCYKSELASIKKMEEYLSMENYQKVVTDYNQLLEQYKGVKTLNKRAKLELK